MDNIIKFEGCQVDIIIENGEPLFEVYSTGMALGQVKKNSIGGKTYFQCRKDRVDENLKIAEITPLVRNGLNYITESQLYDLMLEMKTEKVKPFRKWLTCEVLPSIRKNGIYITDQVLDMVVGDPKVIVGILQNLIDEKEKRIQLENENMQQAVTIEDQIITIVEQSEEITSQREVIDGFLKNVPLADMRQMLNRIVRKKGNAQERWGILYREFDNCVRFGSFEDF